MKFASLALCLAFLIKILIDQNVNSALLGTKKTQAPCFKSGENCSAGDCCEGLKCRKKPFGPKKYKYICS